MSSSTQEIHHNSSEEAKATFISRLAETEGEWIAIIVTHKEGQLTLRHTSWRFPFASAAESLIGLFARHICQYLRRTEPDPLPVADTADFYKQVMEDIRKRNGGTPDQTSSEEG